MARIFRTSDRIPVTIDSLIITISPLTFDQKIELQSIMMAARQDPLHAVKGARLAVKYAVKGVKGVETLDGEEYVPEFEENGLLSDKSVDELLNLEENPKLIAVCSQLISGIPTQIKGMDNKPIKGISIDLPTKKTAARSK